MAKRCGHAQRLGLYSSLRIPIVIGARVRADPGAAVGARDPGAGAVRDRRRCGGSPTRPVSRSSRPSGAGPRRRRGRFRPSPRRSPRPRPRATWASRSSAQGVKALGARAATVYALREDGGGLDLIASEGYPAETMSAWERIPLERADARSPMRSAAARSSSALARGDRGPVSVVRRQRAVLRRRTAHRGGPGDRRHLHRLGRGAPVRRQPEPDRQPRPPGRPGARPGPAVRARARVGRAGCASSRPSPPRCRRRSPSRT